MADYIYMMDTRLTPDQLRVVGVVQEIARAHEMNIYLSGGAVRDIISGFSIRDLDFTVQGNVLKLQKDLQKAGAIVHGSDESMRILYVLFPHNGLAHIVSACCALGASCPASSGLGPNAHRPGLTRPGRTITSSTSQTAQSDTRSSRSRTKTIR